MTVYQIVQIAAYFTAAFLVTYLWYISCCKIVAHYRGRFAAYNKTIELPLLARIWIGAFVLLADVPLNLTLFTLIGLELPRVWKGEWTVTARMKRWKNHRKSRKRKIALFIEPLLDYYDPTGDHF